MENTPRSERRRRVDLDGGHDRRDELEEHDEVEVDAHALNLFLSRRRRLVVLAVATGAPEKPLLPLILAAAGRLARGLLLLNDTLVHAFDDLLHDTRVLARVYRRSLERCGVWERLDSDCLERVVRRYVLEYLRGCKRSAVLCDVGFRVGW